MSALKSVYKFAPFRLFAAFFGIIVIVLALVSLGLLIFLRNSAVIEYNAVLGIY